MNNSSLPRIYQNLDSMLQPNKVVAIMGPRRAGKTTLIRNYLSTTPYTYRYVTGDDISIHEALGSRNLPVLRDFVGSNQLLVIDEAHLIPHIGASLKLMVDMIHDIRIIITGSSSFDLTNQIGEPLVGRKFSYTLYPLSFLELKNIYTPHELNQILEHALIYGSYPEVFTAPTAPEKLPILREITHSYLFKDILIFEGLKNSTTLFNLLRLLAHQIGSEVSATELGNTLDLDKKTVQRYLNLLENAYIITPLHPYFSNQRKSITKKNKYYFLDLGIRNTIIDNHSPLSHRRDLGQLWENYLVVERLKYQSYTPLYCSNYFWRTWEGKEIDWVEMREGKLYGYEFKWNENNKSKNSKSWLNSYPEEAQFSLVNHSNYLNFIT